MNRFTTCEDLSESLRVFYSRGQSVPAEHAVRLVRGNEQDRTTFRMTEGEARALMKQLIRWFPLDALGSV